MSPKKLNFKNFHGPPQVSLGSWPPNRDTEKSVLSSRRYIKARGEEKNEAHLLERAKTLWTLRWSLLKKPANVSVEEKQAIAALEREDEGLVHSFRSIRHYRE